MGVFTDMVKGFFGGAAPTNTNGRNGSTNVVERLCTELGWPVDERDGQIITLHFKDPIVGIRRVSITCGDTGKIMMFNVFSLSSIPARQVSVGILAHLLMRNSEMVTGAWKLSTTDSGTVLFGMSYCALVGGLEAGVFKYVCETLAKEAYAFDDKLRGAGLL